jgi:peptide/nickel transport system permease protein
VSAAAAALRQSRRHPSLLVGTVLVSIVVAVAVVSWFWTPFDPISADPFVRLQGPGWPHVLGTDNLGRDVASQLMVGARVTLLVGIVAVGIAALVGVPLGLLAAVRGGWLGETIVRLGDVVYAFPALIVAVMLAAVHGASTVTAMVAIGVANIPVFARLSRAEALRVLSADYVPAARLAGRGRFAITGRHIVPNIAPVLLVQGTVLFALAILAEAALSYLGLGTPAPTPSWGRMLRESQTFLGTAPLLAVFPGLAIAVAVLGFNLLGDGLRDALDPTLEDRR